MGKSSLLLRFADNTFTESFISTIGVDFKIRNVNIGGSQVRLQIWDTAGEYIRLSGYLLVTGQERFRTITSSYYRGAHGIIVAFDVTNAESFSNVQKWLQEVERYAGDNVQIILVGNKCDLAQDRKISTAEAQEFAEHHNLEYFETSAKDSHNVDPTFLKLAEAIKDKIEE